MRCQHFGHTQRYCGYVPRCVASGETHLSGECSTSEQQLKWCSWGGSHTANYRGRVKWTEDKAALDMRMPVEHGKGSGAPSLPAAPKAKRVERTAEQERLGSCWNHVVRGDRVFRATPPTDPQPLPDLVIEIPTRSEVTNTSQKSKTEKSEPKAAVGPKRALVTKPKKPAKPAKPSQPKTSELVVPPQPDQSPIEISELLNNLALNVCVQLTREILIFFPAPLLG